MRVRKFGVELNSLREENLEQVLGWRNDPEIVRWMIHQDFITFEQHLEWFSTLGNDSQYLMIEWNGRNIGLFNIKNIDLAKRCGEAGIFIGDANYRGSYVPMLTILAMMDMCFDDLGFQCLEARVRKDNAAAIQMNLDLGYQLIAEDEISFVLQVRSQDYAKARLPFSSFLQKYAQDEVLLELSDEEASFFFPVK